jgi:tetratricopeptide (TPR) repeat protein
MSRPNKKLSKEELKEDRVVEWIMAAAEFVREKRQVVVGAGIAAIIVILLINFIISSQKEARVEASALLGDVIVAEGNGQDDEVIRLCEQLIGKYSGTPAAAQGLLLLANRFFALGRYEDAQKLYQSYLDEYEPLDVLVFAAWSGVAASLEAEGQFQNAAKKYQEYADAYSTTMQASLALFEAARCYGSIGDLATQKDILTRITKEFSDSPVAARARDLAGML